MKLKFLIVFFSFFISFNSSTSPIGFTSEEELIHNGISRKFILHTPGSFSENRPLVFVVHGYTSSAQNIMNYSSMNSIADREGFAVVYPQGTTDTSGNTFFNVGYDFNVNSKVDDEGFFRQIVKSLISSHEINPKNIFIAGMSNGGDMSYMMACNASDIFSAIASVTGVMMKDITDNCIPEILIPILEIHGTKDRISSYYGDLENEGGWGSYYGIEFSTKFWVDINSLSKKETLNLRDLNKNDGSTVTFNKYWDKNTNIEVWLYTINGGGHTWPGVDFGFKWWRNPYLWFLMGRSNLDINASEEIWKFFEKYIEE